ncbi:MAG TPA: c-type cytochrome [Thermodesulfobacteriota bacterium]|nr:c-type cytochrome [Deltaproteobacteria bacterium]HNR11985.1 c-type cytochrome [Thermodesulfobacteriota bacterium]
MKFIPSCLVVFTLLLLLTIFSAVHSVEQPVNPEAMVIAGKLFKEKCAQCHGEDGRARTFRGFVFGAQNLADAEWQQKSTDDEIIEAIKKGPGFMPAFDKEFTQSELETLTIFIRNFKETEKDEKESE